MSMSRVCNNRH